MFEIKIEYRGHSDNSKNYIMQSRILSVSIVGFEQINAGQLTN